MHFTRKAAVELFLLDLGLDEADGCDLVSALDSGDFQKRVQSERTGEWMFVFKPRVSEAIIHVKLIIRAKCLVVSFHHDEADDDDASEEDRG